MSLAASRLPHSSLPTGQFQEKYGGGFFFYPHGPGGDAEVFEARRNSAIMCDGSGMVHGTDSFHVGGASGDTLPTIDKNLKTELQFVYGGVAQEGRGEAV